jgi:hypothetical protein
LPTAGSIVPDTGSLHLGDTVGSVILPSLMPVMAWAILCRSFIEGLVRRERGPVTAG